MVIVVTMSRKLLVKELRSLPHRVSLGLRFRSFWVSGFLDVQRKNRPPLMLLMSVCLCLAKSWYVGSKCASHLSQSLCGKELICWIKTALIDMLDQNCSRQCCSLQLSVCCNAGLLLQLRYHGSISEKQAETWHF